MGPVPGKMHLQSPANKRFYIVNTALPGFCVAVGGKEMSEHLLKSLVSRFPWQLSEG